MIFQKFIYKFFSADAHRQIFHDILTDAHDISSIDDAIYGNDDSFSWLNDAVGGGGNGIWGGELPRLEI